MQMAILRHSTTENESESVYNSSRQLANPNYKKPGTKPPIKPKPALKNKDDKYVCMAKGTEVYKAVYEYVD